jgi:hypothetical protein
VLIVNWGRLYGIARKQQLFIRWDYVNRDCTSALINPASPALCAVLAFNNAMRETHVGVLRDVLNIGGYQLKFA